jgi:hypothetical protein
MTLLTVWVQPRASKSEVAGRHGDAIKIRIAAPPVDGAANDELVRFLAKRLGIPRNAVRVRAGAAARKKSIEIIGLSAAEVEEHLSLTGG